MKGAIFCQVNMIAHRFHSKKAITWGNQKCRGAIPDFIAKARIRGSLIKKPGIEKVGRVKEIALIIKIREAMAWGIKYLIADSVELKFNLKRIRGITLIRLSSKPSHLKIHDLEVQAIKVPRITRDINIKWNLFLKIKKEGIKTLI